MCVVVVVTVVVVVVVAREHESHVDQKAKKFVRYPFPLRKNRNLTWAKSDKACKKLIFNIMPDDVHHPRHEMTISPRGFTLLSRHSFS